MQQSRWYFRYFERSKTHTNKRRVKGGITGTTYFTMATMLRAHCTYSILFCTDNSVSNRFRMKAVFGSNRCADRFYPRTTAQQAQGVVRASPNAIDTISLYRSPRLNNSKSFVECFSAMYRFLRLSRLARTLVHNGIPGGNSTAGGL